MYFLCKNHTVSLETLTKKQHGRERIYCSLNATNLKKFTSARSEVQVMSTLSFKPICESFLKVKVTDQSHYL